ncbi:MAG: tRNA lysidine(34) synthetase TilS [Halocynthiibacter sp.]
MADNFQDMKARLRDFLTMHDVRRLGVAVSGGSDSLALLGMLADLRAEYPMDIVVVTVDHGLRSEAKDEAKFVGEICEARGLPHHILTWDRANATGNLQAEARKARYHLMEDWAQEQGIEKIALGHTRDDLAETFLLRLKRGSGLAGLSAMAPVRHGGCQWLRPFLTERRTALQAYLETSEQSWVDDPSNDDPRFDRVKMRQALPALADLGLDVETLARTAENLRSSNDTVLTMLHEVAENITELSYGGLAFQRAALADCPEDVRRRLLTSAIRWLARAAYTPRHEAFQMTVEDVLSGKSRTLHGCVLSSDDTFLYVDREAAALARQDHPYDGIWTVTGAFANLKPVGKRGLLQVSGWAARGIRKEAARALPAIWHEETLIAAPFIQETPEIQFEMAFSRSDFLKFLLSN